MISPRLARRFTPRRAFPLPALLTLLAAAIALVFAPPAAADPPPARVHYQGVLLDSTGNPVTAPTGVYFSIHQGGDATTLPANGALKYREHIIVTPNAQGIFDHAIGSGTVDSGTLDSALFKTADPLFLEVSVGDPANNNNVLLPRARFTTVGYAFVADNAVGDITPRTVSVEGFGQVVDTAGNWTGKPVSAVGLPTAPKITAVTDDTGGRLVVGDVLRIDGSNLASARVFVGGIEAPFVGTPSAAQIKCQIPAGARRGRNAVTLVDTTGGNASVTIAHVDVHRLIVAVRTIGGTGSVAVLDANDRSIVTQFNLSSNVENEAPAGTPLTLQAGFGHQGALLLIPSGFSNIFAVDLTANPPAQVDVFSTGSDYRGVAVSPDGKIAVACDFGASSGNQIRVLPLGQTAPPYGSTVLGTANALESTEIPSGFGATGVVFLNDTQFVTLGRTAARLIGYHRVPDSTGGNVRDIERIDTTDLANNGLTDNISAGNDPVRLQLSPDRTRLLLAHRAANNIQAVYASTFWPAAFSPSAATAAGSLPMKLAVAPDNQTVFVASRNVNDDQVADRLKRFFMVGESITFRGEIVGPHFSSEAESFQIADIEPVDGDLLAVATNDDKIYLSPVGGGTVPIDNDDRNNNTTYLSLRDPIVLGGAARDCVDLAFQP
jgi:hypothetical protein